MAETQPSQLPPFVAKAFLDRAALAQQQDRKYEHLQAAGTLNFRSAVAVAAERVKEAQQPPLSGAQADFQSALLCYGDYLPVTGDIDEASVQRLVTAAETDFYAFAVLKFVAAMPLNDEHLPSLRQTRSLLHLGLICSPKRPSGQSPYAKGHRDALITGEIERLVRWGFTATRNKADKNRTSACDVIVEASAAVGARMTYDVVEVIWRNRFKRKTPDILMRAMFAALGMDPPY